MCKARFTHPCSHVMLSLNEHVHKHIYICPGMYMRIKTYIYIYMFIEKYIRMQIHTYVHVTALNRKINNSFQSRIEGFSGWNPGRSPTEHIGPERQNLRTVIAVLHNVTTHGSQGGCLGPVPRTSDSLNKQLSRALSNPHRCYQTHPPQRHRLSARSSWQ